MVKTDSSKEYRRRYVSINIWPLLDRMMEDGGAPINFLEREYWSGEGKPKAHISVVLGRLEEEGLVKSTIAYDELKYSLTPKGRRIHEGLKTSGRNSLDYNFFITEPKKFPTPRK